MKQSPRDILVGSRNAFHFLGWFTGIVAVYYVLTAIPWADVHVIYPVLEFTAGGASKMLNLLGCNTLVNGTEIQGSDFAVTVRRGCDPLEPILLFCAATVAFPASRRSKFWGIAVGSVVLYSLNLVRIVTLYMLGRRQSTWFYSVHQEWWPALYIVSAVVLWLVWLRWQQRTGRQRD